MRTLDHHKVCLVLTPLTPQQMLIVILNHLMSSQNFTKLRKPKFGFADLITYNEYLNNFLSISISISIEL